MSAKSDEDGIEVRLSLYYFRCGACADRDALGHAHVRDQVTVSDGVGHLMVMSGGPLCGEPWPR